MQTLISIIIPIHNNAKYLKKCLNSVVKQTYSNLEIILVNDASTDNSAKIIHDFAIKDSRIKVFTNKINQGVSVSRNIALENANGKYLTFLDSDDWLPKLSIEKLVKAIEFNNADLCQSRHKIIGTIRKNQKFTGDLNIQKCDNGESRMLCFKNMLTGSVWCKMFKTSIIRENNIRFENLKLYEDTVFLCRYMKHCNILIDYNENTYYYNRLNCNSAILKKHSDLYVWIKEWIEAYLDIFNDEKVQNDTKFTTYIDYICSIAIKHYVLRFSKLESIGYIEKIKESIKDLVEKHACLDIEEKEESFYTRLLILDSHQIYEEFLKIREKNNKLKNLMRKIFSPILYFFIYRLNLFYND